MSFLWAASERNFMAPLLNAQGFQGERSQYVAEVIAGEIEYGTN